MTVSDVGRIAIFFSSGLLPLFRALVSTSQDLDACRNPDAVRVCHPCHFCSEPFDVVLLLFEYIL